MEEDIVPDLLLKIQKDFDNRTFNSKKLKKYLMMLKKNKASYLEVNKFAVEVGTLLSKVLNTHLTVEVLPDGRMYFNIAQRILNDTLRKNYELISSFSEDVQTYLNKEALIGLRAQVPELNQDRIDGIIERLAKEENFDDIKWILDEPIIVFSQSIVDDAIKKNVDFHSKAGLKPKIERTVVGKACKWCKALAGEFDINDAPDDVYRRHDRCRCTVEYRPNKKERQDVWSKEWK